MIAAALRAGAALGLALANIVTLFAPPRVIITGSSLELGEPFIASIRDSYNVAVPPSLAGVPELVLTLRAMNYGHKERRPSRFTSFTNRHGTPQGRRSSGLNLTFGSRLNEMLFQTSNSKNPLDT